MKKVLILLFSIFQSLNSYSQWNYYSPIDSTIASFRLTDNDWVIGLTIHQAGTIPLYDSLGNMHDTDPNGTYIISKINNFCSFRKLDLHFIDLISGYNSKISKLLNISDSSICSYTSDSIKKVEHEWIYPNVYVNDSLKVYDVQVNGDHSPSFRMCFRTKELTEFKRFSEVDIFTSPRLIGFFHENLNYDYNSSTFIYRAFMNLISFLKNRFKIRILE